MCNDIAIFDLEHDTVEGIKSSLSDQPMGVGEEKKDVASVIGEWKEKYCYLPDRERFAEFIDVTTMKSRLQQNRDHDLKGIFRSLTASGEYRWFLHLIVPMQRSDFRKALYVTIRTELDEEKIPYKDVEIGIMIETPAAVMMSEELAQEVDFFSVGTNDLTQYTLAIDRQNPKLDNIYDSHHPAILKMLKMIVDNGHKGGCWVGICGELGADTTLTETFLKMGFDELSVSPSMILKVRQEIRSIELK